MLKIKPQIPYLNCVPTPQFWFTKALLLPLPMYTLDLLIQQSTNVITLYIYSIFILTTTSIHHHLYRIISIYRPLLLQCLSDSAHKDSRRPNVVVGNILGTNDGLLNGEAFGTTDGIELSIIDGASAIVVLVIDFHLHKHNMLHWLLSPYFHNGVHTFHNDHQLHTNHSHKLDRHYQAML